MIIAHRGFSTRLHALEVESEFFQQYFKSHALAHGIVISHVSMLIVDGITRLHGSRRRSLFKCALVEVARPYLWFCLFCGSQVIIADVITRLHMALIVGVSSAALWWERDGSSTWLCCALAKVAGIPLLADFQHFHPTVTTELSGYIRICY